MHLAVPREIVPGEKRVALVPEVIPQLLKMGHTVAVETGAGLRAGFPDDAYTSAGAAMVTDAGAVYANAEMILKVLRFPTSSTALCSLDYSGQRAIRNFFSAPQKQASLS
jgi:NAD(P) transhydrogenase subunit alpha